MTKALSPLQQKLRLNSLKRVRTERSRRLAPVFAAFAETTGRFSYALDQDRQKALRTSIEGLYYPYNAALLTESTTPLPGEDALHAELTALAAQHGVNGDAHLWFGDACSPASHVAPQELDLGFFTADLADLARVVARIVSMEEQVIRCDMALVAADSRWMIYINRDGTLTLTMPR